MRWRRLERLANLNKLARRGAVAVGKPLELVNGNALLRLVDQVKAQPTASAPKPHTSPIFAPATVVELKPSVPDCPKCGLAKVERSNRSTGQRFWGCTSYPKCRGTVAI